MRSAVVVIATVVSLVCCMWTLAAAQVAGPGAEAELQRLQGTWVLISAEMNGKTVHDTHVKQTISTFIGDKFEIIAPHQHKEKILATITKLDLTKNPREMHWVRTTGPNAGITMIAIYEFEGPDQYKTCFDPAGVEVPNKFGTKEGSGHIWHTWKRVKQ